MDRADIERWIEGYERAWRTAGTDSLAELFARDATYLPSPWAQAVTPLDAIARFWEESRDGADEPFEMTSDIVAVDGNTAAVRVAVDYFRAPFTRWRDLWVIEFDDDRRCVAFEEWPFTPDQPDGHEPATP